MGLLDECHLRCSVRGVRNADYLGYKAELLHERYKLWSETGSFYLLKLLKYEKSYMSSVNREGDAAFHLSLIKYSVIANLICFHVAAIILD